MSVKVQSPLTDLLRNKGTEQSPVPCLSLLCQYTGPTSTYYLIIRDHASKSNILTSCLSDQLIAKHVYDNFGLEMCKAIHLKSIWSECIHSII